MTRSFSLAALMLVIAVAAVGLASMRTVVLRVVSGEPSDVATPMILGAIAGGVYGFALGVWQSGGFVRLVASVLGGLCLGLGAGAQITATVDWAVVFAAPALLVGMAVLVGANRRRSFRIREAKGAAAERPLGGPDFGRRDSLGDSA